MTVKRRHQGEEVKPGAAKPSRKALHFITTVTFVTPPIKHLETTTVIGHLSVGWRWAEGYGSGKESYWLLPRQLKLSDGTYIEIEQLKRG